MLFRASNVRPQTLEWIAKNNFKIYSHKHLTKKMPPHTSVLPTVLILAASSATVWASMTCSEVQAKYSLECCHQKQSTTTSLVEALPALHPLPYDKAALAGRVFQDPYNGFYLRFENDYLVEYTHTSKHMWERWYIQPDNGHVLNPPEMIANVTLQDFLASGEAALDPTFDLRPFIIAFTDAAILGYDYLSTWSVRMSFHANYTQMRHEYYDACMQRADGARYNTGIEFTTVLQEVTGDVAGLPPAPPPVPTAPALRSVSYAILKDYEGRYLVQLRSEAEEMYPGVWSLFGGTVEAEETPTQAVYRELREEIGYEPPAPLIFLRSMVLDGVATVHFFFGQFQGGLEALRISDDETVDAALATAADIASGTLASAARGGTEYPFHSMATSVLSFV